jgi:hypothetical protein
LRYLFDTFSLDTDRELGVRYLIECSVRKAGNRVRIAAQLIDALSGAHLWADNFDGKIDDILGGGTPAHRQKRRRNCGEASRK